MSKNPFLTIDQRFELKPLPPANQPIFLLSSIWRSGSTLVQRTLATDHDIMMWGEPYADCNLLSSLSRSALALTQDHWPTMGHFARGMPQVFANPEDHFIANLYPDIEYLRIGHRAFLDQTFWKSAEAHKRNRFGIKFVRLGLQEAQYLQWLYPDAKFIILIRNPWDCWRSYKGYQWLYRWPKQLVYKVEQFSLLWKKQTTDLLQFEGNQYRLRYEDFLREDFDWAGLREFTGLENISRRALDKKITGVNQKPLPITEQDQVVVQKICGQLANQLGYLGLKETDANFQWSSLV